MKKNFIILSLLLIFLTGCGKEPTNPTSNINSKEEGSEIMFDRENSLNVIQEGLQCDNAGAKAVVGRLELSKIKGAIKAELIKDDDNADTFTVLEIESEDHKKYRLYFGSSYIAQFIKDMETGKYIYASKK